MAAFACTDYKVQGGTFDNIGLELRGTRVTNVNGEMVHSQCDGYSLYVQVSRGKRLEGIMLIYKARERDFIGNKIPEDMMAAEERLELPSNTTITEAETWG